MDSLKAMKIVATLAHEFDIRLAVAQVLECTTLEVLCDKAMQLDLAAEPLPEWPPATELTEDQNSVLPVSATQLSMLLHHHLLDDANKPSLNSGPGLFTLGDHLGDLLSGYADSCSPDQPVELSLRTAVLEPVMAALVHRHETLRCTFQSTGFVADNASEPSALARSISRKRRSTADGSSRSASSQSWYDPSALSAVVQLELVDGMYSQALVSRMMRHVFELELGPLVLGALIRPVRHSPSVRVADSAAGIQGDALTGTGWAFCLSVHHLCVDGTSNSLLVRDLHIALEQALQVCCNPADQRMKFLSSLDAPIQHRFASYVEWERRMLRSGFSKRCLEYWTAELQGCPRSSLSSSSGDQSPSAVTATQVLFEIPRALVERLTAYGYAHEA